MPEELQFLELRHNRISGGMRDVSDAVLLSSRPGSTRYDFTFKESFVRPGLGQSNWSTRTNYPALGVVQTGPAEMSLYLQRDYGQSTAHLQRLSVAPGWTRLPACPLSGRRNGDQAGHL